MAAQVLSGTGNVSYTNSTGQNVRIVINYLEVGVAGGTPTISFGGCSVTVPQGSSYGKSLGYQHSSGRSDSSILGQNATTNTGSGSSSVKPLPLEIAIANGDTFSINTSNSSNIKGYNIIIIPEAG